MNQRSNLIEQINDMQKSLNDEKIQINHHLCYLRHVLKKTQVVLGLAIPLLLMTALKFKNSRNLHHLVSKLGRFSLFLLKGVVISKRIIDISSSRQKQLKKSLIQ